MQVTLIIIIIVLIVNLILLFYVMTRLSRTGQLSYDLERLERHNKEDSGLLRQELNANLLGFNDSIRLAIETQLDKMRATVDEKLQTTLEKRIGESFSQVSERLEKVHQGLGEMQNLALGVGDLKRVLTNVKSRGVWGEVQLGALLEQMLAPDQFMKNVKIKENTMEAVEYCVCLPDGLIPIDAKFPYEDYERLIEAADKGDNISADLYAAELEKRIKLEAKRISEKYIYVPKTTDFAIMFLPTEGLYAEVCNLNIIDELQRKFNITVTGPSTTIAYINALRMGFQTLAIKKQTNEIGKFAIALNNELKIYAESIEKAIAAMDKAKTQLQVDVSKRANILSSKINNIITTYEKIQDSESEQENN